MARKKSCLGDGKKACSPSLVTVAKKQAKVMLDDAERSARTDKCRRMVGEAREAFGAAEKRNGPVVERRNAYIRATYLAGQAKSCSTIEGVGPRQRKARKPRKKKA